MWPRTSTSAAPVCSAVCWARVLAADSLSMFFWIRIFTISFRSSCLFISVMICVVVPSLPIQMVGFSVLSSCFILRFILAVSVFCLPPVFQRKPCTLAAHQACHDDVWFAEALQAHAAVNAGQDESFAMSANLPSAFCGHSYFGGHADSSCRVYVMLCQGWVFVNVFSGELEQCVYAFECDLFGFIHEFLRSPYVALRAKRL